MNVLYTHRDPDRCAMEHCSFHMAKKVREYAKILSTVYRVKEGEAVGTSLRLYTPYPRTKPHIIWCLRSASNYNWLYACWSRMQYVIKEYEGSFPPSMRLHGVLAIPPKGLPNGEFTEPPLMFESSYDKEELHRLAKLAGIDKAYQSYLNKIFLRWWGEGLSGFKKPCWYGRAPDWVSPHLVSATI